MVPDIQTEGGTQYGRTDTDNSGLCGGDYWRRSARGGSRKKRPQVIALLFAALIACLILAGIGRYAAVEPSIGRAALLIIGAPSLERGLRSLRISGGGGRSDELPLFPTI
jgi:hypothetical protein